MKKNKKYYCKDCGKRISTKTTKRCQSCYHKWAKKVGLRRGKNHSQYIDGRSLEKYYCIDCDKEISRKAKRCKSCSHKGKRNFMYKKRKENSPHWKGDKAIFRKIYHCKEEGCNNIICARTALYGKEMCLTHSNSGKNNTMYGKKSPNTKRIWYKRICFRSTWEANFAKFLDLSGIRYQYESKRFYFKDCSYLPDFYIPKWNLYIEIKGWFTKEHKKRIGLFKEYNPDVNIKVYNQNKLEEIGVL